MTRSRASLYVRLSRQATDSNLSLDGMRDDLRDLCQREGLTEVALHVDDGLSGGYRDRPAFAEWLADARSGRADVLLTWAVDRLTREGLNVAAQLLDVVEGKDPETGRQISRPVRLLDIKGLDSEHGETFRLRFVLQAEIARAERERMRERAKTAHRRLSQAGRYRGGAAPYGYRAVDAPDGKGKTLEIDQREAEAIRECVDRVLNGNTLNRVARWLNDQGYKPRRAAQWSRAALVSVLVGDAILGRVSRGGKPVRDSEGEILAPFPAIVTEAESTALRAACNPGGERKTPMGRRPSRLLSGLLTCWSCGTKLTVWRRTGKAAAYRCASRSQGLPCAGSVTVGAETIEEHVTALYLGEVGDMPLLHERVIVEGVDELTAVDADIADIMAQVATQATASLFERLTALQARRAALESKPPTQRVEIVDTGQTIAEWWEGAHLDDRRDTLAGHFEQLTLEPGKRGQRTFDPGRLAVTLTRKLPDRAEVAEMGARAGQHKGRRLEYDM
ncbi:recombinase family protein [Streptomyces sp. OS603R]|uniref:recombinase family protein n=1 Tax=Streptomyces sp. OS603R TaxID=3035287 RepID=UPI002434C2F6|nr:recombinase family protein [Streptomyces sp. OS603R]